MLNFHRKAAEDAEKELTQSIPLPRHPEPVEGEEGWVRGWLKSQMPFQGQADGNTDDCFSCPMAATMLIWAKILRGNTPMPDLSKWTKVVTHPLGFAGFGLACISGALATWGPDKYPWLPYLFIGLASGVVVIGVVLAFKETPKEKKKEI
ncbi:MAG: hypothetical protein IID17_13000 [Nitrospinae bacterium]|nr:hypothetical protein [Nitrospinota bacterium]